MKHVNPERSNRCALAAALIVLALTGCQQPGPMPDEA